MRTRMTPWAKCAIAAWWAKERVEIRSGPPGFSQPLTGVSSDTRVPEVAHSVGKLLRQRGCFRFQDTGGINDKNFRKLSPSALSSIWRTRRKGILSVLLRASDNSPMFRVLLATSGHRFPRFLLKIVFLHREIYFHVVPGPHTTRNLEIFSYLVNSRSFVWGRCVRPGGQYGRSNCERSNAARW